MAVLLHKGDLLQFAPILLAGQYQCVPIVQRVALAQHFAGQRIQVGFFARAEYVSGR
jgi:hypothetical protein